MAGRISEYVITVVKRLMGVDLMDASVLISTDPDVFDSRKMPYSIIERDIGVIAEKASIDLGFTGTTALDFALPTGKKVIPTKLILIGGLVGKVTTQVAQIRINLNSGVGDIVPLTTLTQFNDDNQIFILNIEGVLLSRILTDTDTINFEVVVAAGPTPPAAIQPVETLLFGSSQDGTVLP